MSPVELAVVLAVLITLATLFAGFVIVRGFLRRARTGSLAERIGRNRRE